uniref:Retrotransposon gag domain-containing protein n=1 Tax=Tanacetum cinerariifolium TaxID=118510 RepID=A0A6L2NNC9_TANCI|nr:hypothetical protein [Tanacetum cinerariifolium]
MTLFGGVTDWYSEPRGTEGAVGLSRWFKKVESIFHISGCDSENQVKFATCTLLDAALTWWNGHLRTLGHDAAYAMTWETLKKKITDKYYPRGEIKKLEIELWNLKVKGNDVGSYTQRFQELALMCTKFVFDENEKVDKYIGGLPDSIHRLQTGSKRKFDNNNQAQQLPKRQKVTKAYTVGTGEMKEYAGTLPLCNKCKIHHNGPCTTKCGHYKSDCPKLKNQNHGNQAEGTGARGMVYALGGEETNQDLNDIEDDINA